MARKYQYMIIGIIIFLSSVVLYIANTTLAYRTSELKAKMYSDTTNEISDELELLIKNKKQSTLAIALALSHDQYMVEALKNKDTRKLQLEKLSYTLREFTRFKNVWFQIIDNKGNSFYRSWTKDRGDFLYNARGDVRKMLKDPQVISSISVGKYDMTFKSMVPVRDVNNNFVGIFEIITHFNSISRKLSEDKYHSVILVDKKYKSQLEHPFTKTFVNDYYVANLDADQKYLDILRQKGVESFLHSSRSYIIDEENNYYFSLFKIPNIYGTDMGYILIFKKLSDFTTEKIETLQKNVIVTMIFIILTIMILGYFIFNKQYNSLLQRSLDQTKEEKEKINAILSAQPYIIIIVHKNRSYDVNNKFFEFFDKYKDLKTFQKDHNCICTLFVKPDKDDGSYIYDNGDWINLILEDPKKSFKAAIYKGEELHHFVMKAVKPKIKALKDDFTIITFIDITEIKQKDELLFEQSKNASMGEMIGNIAHQWRQPLSVISTSATGMLLQQEIGKLDDRMIKNYCENINENAQYLSKTIDDFRDFIKGESKLVEFEMKDHIQKLLNLIGPVAKNNNIELDVHVEDVTLSGYPNQLLQCYINIFNNSKDAFKQPSFHGEKKKFYIMVSKSGNKVFIIFKDNGGGIDKNIIDKVFEPYFTTKHKSQGTGLGLHMVYNLIIAMGGTIRVENEVFEEENIQYVGAKVIITFRSSI